MEDNRDDLLLAVSNRVKRVERGQPSAVLEPNAAVEASALAATLRDGHGDTSTLLVLGWFYWHRFLALPRHQRHERDREAALKMFRPAFLSRSVELGQFPEPLRPMLADQSIEFAENLLSQVGSSDDMGVIDTTAEFCRRLVDATPADHPERAGRLYYFSFALRTRFLRTDKTDDLDEIINTTRQAVAATPADDPLRAEILILLLGALRSRFELIGAFDDLNETIDIARQTVTAIPPDHPQRPTCQMILDRSLRTLSDLTKTTYDLDGLINSIRNVLTSVPLEPSDRAIFLNGLGNTLYERFDRSGEMSDLDDAIDIGRQAIAATSPDQPERALHLSVLSLSLKKRFERIGAIRDLDDAIDIARQAIAATPPDQPKRAGDLSTLSNLLRERFRRTHVTDDLDDAIDVARQAVNAARPDHPEQGLCLNCLGQSLMARFDRFDEMSDLNDAIDVGRQALAVTSPDDPQRAAALINLGLALRRRFERTRATDDQFHPPWNGSDDLDEAISVTRQAVNAIPPDHPKRPLCLFNLGLVLGHRDIAGAVDAWEAAAMASEAPPSLRIHAARASAECIPVGPETQRGMWARVIELRSPQTRLAAHAHRAAALMEMAVRLLPEATPRQFQWSDQQYVLTEHRELACDAAALTLDDISVAETERTAKALQLLELGRAVLLSQALQVRGDLTDLADQHPDLAEEFVRLRDVLDTGSGTMSSVEETGDRHRVAAAFSEVMRQIRLRPGFESFGLPPSIDALMAEAAQGPIVVLNVSRYRSDAILVTVDEISCLPLPGLTRAAVIEQGSALNVALAVAHDRYATPNARIHAQSQISATLVWLWENATGPVLKKLGYTDPHQSPERAPRVWWVPTGVLSSLPIHAAGDHSTRKKPVPLTVMDRVVSSYTPTIGALRHARQPRTTATAQRSPQSLVIAMPTTPTRPGEKPIPELPNADKEADAAASRLFNVVKLVEPGHDPDRLPAATYPAAELPTTATVLQLLAESPIVHFACHGINDANDPSLSQLLLHDHETTPLTVAALQPINLDNARLAYLSACRTATNNADLLDEAIHLTSAFQMAGYPHVIGTLWPIGDETSVDVAAEFYDELGVIAADQVDNVERAARALHQAIRTARESLETTPSLWAAYIHAGR